jgi:hypothetical protein
MPELRAAQDDTEPELPPRQRLLLEVRRGALTPDKAEAEANRLGIRPLLDRSDPEVFDPMREDRWTLTMTIAWIVWRTPEAVREHWPAFVIGCERWREVMEGRDVVGYEPAPVPMPWWPLLALSRNYPRERTRKTPWRPRSPQDAREELWKALEQRDVEADGIDLDTKRRVDIPATAWKALHLYPELEWDIVREDQLSRSGYEDLRFPVRQVIDAWPDRALCETLPPLIAPDGPGYMPLSAATQWIATKGGTCEVGHDSDTWDDAYRQLLERVSAEEIAVTGVEAWSGQRERLDGTLFGGMRCSHLFGAEELEDTDSIELYLWASPYLDEEHWRAGFGDDLRRRRRTIWSKLMVSKADVRRLFAYGPSPSPSREKGRPRNVMRGPTLAQFRRLAGKGEVEPTLAAQSRALVTWQAANFPDLKPMAPRYITSLIREAYCQHFDVQKKG